MVFSLPPACDAGFNPKAIILIDVAGGYGGTWYWNRYPKLMGDFERYCYLLLLEETGYVPKHKYSYGAEIRSNAELIAARYGLQGMFCTKIDRQVWDDAKGYWVVNLTQSLGHIRPSTKLTVRTQFIFMAGGLFSISKIPNVTGFTESRNTVRYSTTFDGITQLLAAVKSKLI